MPMVYQQNINPYTKMAVWHINENEIFFKEVPLQRTITHPHKRLQHLAARFLLKELYPDFPYDLIKIADTRKPFLENEAYHFSISHCGDYAAVLVSTAYRVGMDIERISSKVEKVKHKFLSIQEQQLLTRLAEQNHQAIKLLTIAWSIKESLYKWYGVGELDFIEHMHIEDLSIDVNEGKASCVIDKTDHIELLVHFLIFNDDCVSWVISL